MRVRPDLVTPVRRGSAALLTCALLATAAALLPPCALAADTQPHLVQDPHYGDGLFHFYQGDYFTSLTSLMVSQHFERVPHHVDEAEVLRGGLLLSYGLHREAGEIFTQLIETSTTPAVRDRAWYFLAKIRYQRGFLADAGDAIARIEHQLPGELEQDRQLLLVNLMMARNDYAEAARLLRTMTGSTGAGVYSRYNLGVALIRSGEVDPGRELLDELGRAKSPDVLDDAPGAAPSPVTSTEEFQNLRDRANLALGFAALQEQRPEQARGYLERVRLQGMESNKALLGFGWAAAAMKDAKAALVPWTELAARDASDAAVLEAKIAVPYAYAELGAYGQALERYNEAIAVYEGESRGLDESIASIRSGRLLDALLTANPSAEMGWFWAMDQLPELPHAGHLAPVLATHEFQEAFKNYRDLRFLAGNLKAWADKLGIFDDMLANRREAYAVRLPQIMAKAGGSGLDALQKRGLALDAELSRAEEDADGVAFADATQREQLARLANVQGTLFAAGADPAFDAARERARLVDGALHWQLAQDHPVRLWEARKSLAQISEGLAEARRHDAALVQAQRDEPVRFAALDVRIKALGPRIQALIPQVAALQAEQQQALQELAVTQLTQQKARLADYITQAQFAVAQLYDRASLRSPTDHAPKR